MTATDTVRQQLLPSVSEFLARERPLLIGDSWQPAASGRTFETLNPATGEVLARVAHGEAEDIDRAVRAARAAFEPGSPWRRTTPRRRAHLLWRMADLIEEHADELAQLETLDNGKPFWAARNGDIVVAAELFRYFGGWATKIEGTTIPMSNDEHDYLAYTVRE